MAEKSLDDRIKEAELAKLKSEDEKLKAETDLGPSLYVFRLLITLSANL